jgi:hypothetical protein
MNDNTVRSCTTKPLQETGFRGQLVWSLALGLVQLLEALLRQALLQCDAPESEEETGESGCRHRQSSRLAGTEEFWA